MLSISSSQPAIWSSPSPVVAPVVAASAVSPVQPASRDTQTGSGMSGRESLPSASGERSGAAQAERGEAPAAVEAAPLLPRESPDAPDQQGAEALSEADVDEQQRQAEEKALKQQLQDVISNIWKASAAVVEVALGRDTPATENPGAAVAGAIGPSAASAGPIGAPASQDRADAANDAVAEQRATQAVVAYDAQGHSSLAPLEAGTLVNRHV